MTEVEKYSLEQVKKEWLQGLILGSIVTFIVMYVWFKWLGWK